jgi:hypothetical protein
MVGKPEKETTTKTLAQMGVKIKMGLQDLG